MNKQIITFDANEQSLIKTGGVDKYSSNKVSYIEAHFNLGENWQGYDSVRAVWSTWYECISTVLDTEGICIVPYEVLKRTEKVMVNLVGSISEDDVLTDRLTSYPIVALTVDADAKVCGSNTQPITPSEYEQFVEAVKADADRAEEAKEDARGFASSAEISAQNASISETNASTSEDNAKASELNAETYKNQAQTYAQNAHNSAISAENAKDEAEDARDTILGMRAEATTLPEGSSATASYNDGVMSFGIPKGDTGARGATGETGATPQLSIGTVTTTTEPSVTITGTAENPVLNFGLVKGDKGDTGEVSLAELIKQTTVQTNSDNEPYLFRATPECGRYELDEIVGGTVAWNQMVRNGNFADLSGWYVYSGTGTVSNNELTVANAVGRDGVKRQQGSASLHLINGHKYLYSVEYKSEYDLEMHFVVRSNILSATNVWTRFAKVNAYTGEGLAGAIDTFPKTSNQTCTFSLRNVMCIDLTLMFGSTIADYIYSLETATAGVGVAWFKKLFPKPYYAYNAGELKSVSGLVSHDMTGFNQWDEVWESGNINNQGQPEASSNWIRSKNYFEVVPNTSYCFTAKDADIVYAFWYDADKNFISLSTVYTNNNFSTAISPQNAVFCRIKRWVVTEDKRQTCVNISWDGSRNGEYEPYVKHSYALDDSLILRGIPKLDSSNNLYYDGDTYESDGTVTRKYGVVDLGTFNWTYQSGRTAYYSNTKISDCFDLENWAIARYKCAKYVSAPVNNGGADDKIIGVYGRTIYIRDTSLGTDETTFKTAMSGVYLAYELATPTTETADPYTNPQRCEKGGTEEYVSTSIVPVGHNTDYPMTLEDTIPTTDGTYSLTVTVSGGKNTVSWS